MKQRIITSALAVGILGVAAGFFLSHGEAPHATPSAPAPGDSAVTLAALRAEVSALRQQLQANASSVSALQTETGRLSAVVEADSAETDPDGSEPRDPRRPSRDLDSSDRAEWLAARAATIATTEANFLAEPRNGAWSSEKESALRESAGSFASLAEQLRGVSCRAKTCRVEVEDEEATRQELRSFLHECGRSFPKIMADHVSEPGGKPSYVFYLMSDT